MLLPRAFASRQCSGLEPIALKKSTVNGSARFWRISHWTMPLPAEHIRS